MQVRYLGLQPQHRDHWYGAGVVWAPGETQEVDDEIARKLITRWPDLYAEVVSPELKTVTEEGEAPNQPAEFDLDQATRAEMLAYAASQFGEKIPANTRRDEVRERLAFLLNQESK